MKHSRFVSFLICTILVIFNISNAEADEFQDWLKAHKVNEKIVNDLAKAGNAYGYGPVNDGIKNSFAVIMAGTCLDVRSGKKTWKQSISEDIKSGAPQTSARKFNDYLKNRYCPKVR